MSNPVDAVFHYVQWKDIYVHEKPYEIFIDDFTKLNGIDRTNLEFQPEHAQKVYNVRGRELDFSLDRHGFTWREHEAFPPAALKNEAFIKSEYLPAMERLIRSEVDGADRVVFFDWRLRMSREEKDMLQRTIDLNDKMDPLHPSKYPHVDQTPEGATMRCHHHLKDEAERLLRGRFRIINLWRPLYAVNNWPLAVCDARTVQRTHLLASDFVRRKYNGETYFALFDPNMRWYYLDHQQPNEVTMLKMYDSSKDVEANYCVHASFPNENGMTGAVRESLEVRAMVFTYADSDVVHSPP